MAAMEALRVVPATSALAGALPFGGLQRGTTTLVSPGGRGVAGSTSLALELLAGVSAAGGWCAAAGLEHLGLAAAAEHGIDLERFLVVPDPGGPGRWQQVLATLLDGVDAVMFCPASTVRAPDARKLCARVRERRSMLVVLDRHGRWSEPADLRCQVTSSTWSGLGEGHGLLSARTVELEVSGRGRASRPLHAAVSRSYLDRTA
ncbi:MAG TPA: hypothetical protein VKU92_03210 [Acidimicrobiales bacterium]|nr:hypothetical protein [Acidimicrobiales bacterium]